MALQAKPVSVESDSWCQSTLPSFSLAVVVGRACWLMLLPMLPRLCWVKDAGLGLGLEGRRKTICFHVNA